MNIGKYEILGEVGRGGMGLVYRAYDPQFQRMVAIKVVLSDDADLLERFKIEAIAAGKLRHKNIITVHDYGEHEGKPYLVMEYLEGQDLQSLISSKQALTLLDKTLIMVDVAEALEHAHQNEIVHRDVKPANVMCLSQGTVKLMDFGIARLLQEGTSRLTQHGSFIGTLPYIAPEVLEGVDSEHRSDIYSYGLMYYVLLTGDNPFVADEMAHVMSRITKLHPVPVRTVVPECPPELDALISRAMHKDPDLRYESFEDLLFDLLPIRNELASFETQKLIEEAGVLLQAGEVQKVQATVHKLMKLDPNNQATRELRDKFTRAIWAQAQEQAALDDPVNANGSLEAVSETSSGPPVENRRSATVGVGVLAAACAIIVAALFLFGAPFTRKPQHTGAVQISGAIEGGKAGNPPPGQDLRIGANSTGDFDSPRSPIEQPTAGRQPVPPAAGGVAVTAANSPPVIAGPPAAAATDAAGTSRPEPASDANPPEPNAFGAQPPFPAGDAIGLSPGISQPAIAANGSALAAEGVQPPVSAAIDPEKEDWDKTDRGSLIGLQDFVRKHPNSEHKPEAQSAIDKIQTAAIRHILDNFAKAFQEKNLKQLKQIFPNLLPGFEQSTRGRDRLSNAKFDLDDTLFSEESATLKGEFRYDSFAGNVTRTDTIRVSLTVRHRNNDWIIEDWKVR